jgi:hypothetical protein
VRHDLSRRKCKRDDTDGAVHGVPGSRLSLDGR